jgi:hypothetical protein
LKINSNLKYYLFPKYEKENFLTTNQIFAEGHDLLDYEYKLKTNFFLITFIELSIASNHFQNI